MKLSICIATFNRARFIGETLDAILPQLTPEVELLVVDGASSDGTAALMADYERRCAGLVYHRESENSGFDRDYDKAVRYARGEYCWLMSDDDILSPDAVSTVLAQLRDDPQLVVVNAEIRTRDLSVVLKPNQLELQEDIEYGEAEHERLFAYAGRYLSFIGAVVIRRAAWTKRGPAAYFDSMFAYFGVLFQAPEIGRAKIIARPLIRIRYGNALWTPRAFDIWINRWPALIWSFVHFSEQSKSSITARSPALSIRTLVWYRALDAYGPAQYRALIDAKQPHHALAWAIAKTPASLANAFAAVYMFVRRHSDARVMLYDLLRANCASAVTRWVARRFRFPEMEILDLPAVSNA
jgi:abequosyltransferase